jgi:hypothetical protein
MKKLTLVLGIILCSLSSFSQSVEEVITTTEERFPATEGTYQLIFKDENSKDWFFSQGIKSSSDYIGVDGINTFTDLLVVIGENRQQSKEQEYLIGDNNELTIKVPSLDYINSSEFQSLEEIVITK